VLNGDGTRLGNGGKCPVDDDVDGVFIFDEVVWGRVLFVACVGVGVI
jgi:hypothetical protein